MGSAGTADACAAAGARVTSTRVHSARLKASLLDMASDTPLSADARAAAVFALQGFALDRDEYALFKQLAAETRLAASEPDHDHRRRDRHPTPGTAGCVRQAGFPRRQSHQRSKTATSSAARNTP